MFINKQRGFTFIEVLVSLLVFWLGLLGIALYTASGLKTASSNQARATSVYAASLAMEPILYHTRPDCLSAALQATFPRKVTSDNSKDSYLIDLVRATDGSGAQIAAANAITTAYGTWVSPVTITLGVPYTGINGTVIAYPSYTVVLDKYTVACNV